MRVTNIKIIYSGAYIEAYLYKEKLLNYDFTIPEGRATRGRIVVVDEESRLRKEESRRRSMQRASSQLRRLINRNVRRWYKMSGKSFPPVFATFTFKEDVRGISDANPIFSKFIKRLNYFIGSITRLKYVVVIEFQDLNRRGVIHYHTVFFNLPFVWGDKLAEIWGQGMVDIKQVRKVKNLGAYLTKYLSKNFKDGRLDENKRYFSSRGLLKPTEIRDYKRALEIMRAIPKECKIKEREFKTEYYGKIIYKQFLIEDQKSLISQFPEFQ